MERSLLGIAYEDKHKPIRHLYKTAEEPRPAKLSEGRKSIYEQIHEKPCEHAFARTGFCRYRKGSIGCGASGGNADVRGRHDLVFAAFEAFERIREKELAVRSCQLIEREFPLKNPPRALEWNLVKEAEERAEKFRKMHLLVELLGLVKDKDDWEMVLDHAVGGFRGDIPLLSRMRAVTSQVEDGKKVSDLAAASLLAQRSATSDELLGRMMKDNVGQVADRIKPLLIRNKRLELFGLALDSYSLSEQEKIVIRKYQAEDFLRLLALGDNAVDEMCAENIWYTDHFVLLDPMLAALNRNDSKQARETIEKLLRGGNPYSRGGIPSTGSGGYDPDYMWNRIETMREPVETMRKLTTANLRGPNNGMSMKFYEAVKGIGATKDHTQWPFLKEIYLEGSNVWAMAVLGRAMHQLDAQATEQLLIDNLRNEQGVRGTISAMGFIGSGKFAPALEEFAERPRPAPSPKDNLPKNYYEADGDGTALLSYALHRCRGIPSWKLVKNTEGQYVIEKPTEVSR